MSALNVRIITELQAFVNEVAFNSELTNQFRFSEKDFTRKRKLCFKNLSLLIVSLCKKTLSVEMDDFFSALKSQKTCSVAAFSLQRAKLNPKFFYAWNLYFCEMFYHFYSDKIKRWKGYRVIGCDGSNIALVNRPELNRYFGGQSNQTSSFIGAKTFYCFDVLNKIVLHSRIKPYRQGEMSTAYEILKYTSLDPDMLMMYDRHFSNYKMAALMQWQEREIKYVIRVKDSLNLAKQFIKSKKLSDEITMYPTAHTIQGLKEAGYIITKNTPLKTRLILVQLSTGAAEVLMTNLWEHEGYKVKEFKELYALRWGVETNIGFQKNIQQLESLSGLTPNSVMQDFYATVFICNLHFLLIKDAQDRLEAKPSIKSKYPLQVNNNKAFGKIKHHIVELFISKDPNALLETLTEYFIRAPLPIRKNRSYPRIRKNPLSKSKFRTFSNYKPAF
jgi:hypothetical protein